MPNGRKNAWAIFLIGVAVRTVASLFLRDPLYADAAYYYQAAPP